ncbi:DNA topoisomerase I, mitochondrial-like [Actinia tenebrosa]|uniref:DNA topoisomerase I n=1 Tax=Actinia tenebrosa TaxID=6105 RepID=A0A6P8I5N7_ACTTE|nr:DNA topoisomerase I, mitochondrial-like [Actinia tenebrosa]
MNGESTLLANNDHELKRKAENGRPANGEDSRLMGDKQIKSPGPERKKLKVGSNDVIAKSSVKSPLNSPKVSPTKSSSSHPPVKLIIKKEAVSPLKNHAVAKPHKPLSPTKKATVKPEPKSSPVKSDTPKPKASSQESDDDDDIPLARRVQQKTPKAKVKTEGKNPITPSNKPTAVKNSAIKKEKSDKPVVKKPAVSDDSDDEPLSNRIAKPKPTSKTPDKKPGSSSEKKKKKDAQERKRKSINKESDSEDEYKPLAKLAKKSSGKTVKSETKDEKPKKKIKSEKDKKGKGKGPKSSEKTDGTGKKKKKKEEEEKEVWKWWEEKQHEDGRKWTTLEHHGPYLPPDYEPLPDNVKFYYDGKPFKLSMASEEIAGFYAKMLQHDYTGKEIFNENFFHDWRKEMTEEERKTIKDLKKCDFKEMFSYYDQKNEERKNMTKEEKQVIKKNNEVILNEYGYCVMDGHKQRVGNFKIEPPGLFRGRGDHPKQGKLKKRVMPEDIIINIGKGAKVPVPPDGRKWKKVIHDDKVTWLACWIENIQGSYKYVMLNPTSRLKGEKDWKKYETARKLKDLVEKIRENYRRDWKSKEMRIRQRGVALYFIDKLALRAGHEKDDDTADTVGCCSLRVEHIKLHDEWEDKECVVEFDFLGKDSVRYWNFVPIDKKAFKNLKLFMEGKQEGDDLFDRLTTTSLNKYLSELMEGLSAKVFRTFNASMTLQDQLDKLTNPEDNVNAKVLQYNRANRAVAILCNHQRTVPKTFEKSMSNLQVKIADKKKAVKDAKKELKELKHKLKESKTDSAAKAVEKKKAQVQRLEEQLFKLEVTATDKEENKEIALGTSKLNYLDPRITVAWCKKFEVPIEKAYNKTQREKFAWAIDMATEDYVF